MLLVRVLNACHWFPGSSKGAARLCETAKAIGIEVCPRRGSRAIYLLGGGQKSSSYERLAMRRFELFQSGASWCFYCTRCVAGIAGAAVSRSRR